MGGAPITFTLYENGIHVTYASPDFVSDPGIEKRMREAFDAGEDAVLATGGLEDLITPAVDTLWAEDKRHETYDGVAIPLGKAIAMARRR